MKRWLDRKKEGKEEGWREEGGWWRWTLPFCYIVVFFSRTLRGWEGREGGRKCSERRLKEEGRGKTELKKLTSTTKKKEAASAATAATLALLTDLVALFSCPPTSPASKQIE